MTEWRLDQTSQDGWNEKKSNWNSCSLSPAYLIFIVKSTEGCSSILYTLLTQNPVSALQLEGLLVAAEVVDEVAELLNVLQALGHHHLLVDQVWLGQVGAGLGGGEGGDTQHNVTIFL